MGSRLGPANPLDLPQFVANAHCADVTFILLSMVELTEHSRMVIDELIDVMGRAPHLR